MGDLADEDEALMELHWREPDPEDARPRGSERAREGGIMDDMLERAKKEIERCPAPRRVCSSCATIDALAADVRELRKDRERLRKELHQIVGLAFDDGCAHHNGPSAPRIMALTDLVDIALSARGEDAVA